MFGAVWGLSQDSRRKKILKDFYLWLLGSSLKEEVYDMRLSLFDLEEKIEEYLRSKY